MRLLAYWIAKQIGVLDVEDVLALPTWKLREWAITNKIEQDYIEERRVSMALEQHNQAQLKTRKRLR